MIDALILIFVSVTILGSLALFVRQPLIVVYVAVGCVLGPFVLGWVSDVELLNDVGEIGIIFLLFIIGLELPPNRFLETFAGAALIAFASSVVFFLLGFGAGFAFGFSVLESTVLGIACMFSSTVLGVKLLPRTVLHHRHIGDVVIRLLLLQDVLAVIAIVALGSQLSEEQFAFPWMLSLAMVPVLVGTVFLGARFVVIPLLTRFDVYTEFLFLLYIGWCLAVAGIAHEIGLGFELGAFLAGVSLANAPVSQAISKNLEPLRDFFLIMFFFTVGAQLNPGLLWTVLWQALALSAAVLAVKPVVFRYLLKWRSEHRRIGWEVGLRLGQCSEFSLLVLYIAAAAVSDELGHVILGTTIFTMLISTYIVIRTYKSPLAAKPELLVA